MNLKTLFPLALPALLACGSTPSEDSASSDDSLVRHGGDVGGVIGTFDNVCGNAATTPQITSTNVISPSALDTGGDAPPYFNPTSGRMAVQNIQYVSGGAVRVDLSTDGCTFVKDVHLGSHVLTPTFTNGYWYSAQDSRNDALGHSIVLWIFYPQIGDGSTEQISVTFGRSAGAGTATTGFPLVHVKSVQPRNVDSSIGIGGSEIKNQVAGALNSKFQMPLNSTVMNGRRIYDYDPSKLAAYIDNTGIWISFQFKAEVDNWCDPTVRVTGTFVFDTNVPGQPLGLSVRWVNPMHANMDWGACSALEDVPFVDIAYDIVTYLIVGDNGAGASVQKTLTDEITKALPSTGGGTLFLHGTTTRPDELRVNLLLPAPAIDIQVPYDAFDMGRTATRFPSGQPLTIMADQLGMRDLSAGTTNQFFPSGPNGVTKHTASSLSNQLTVDRASHLVVDSLPVGRVMAKTDGGITVGSAHTYGYTPGCQLTAPAATIFSASTLRFGVNDDAADAQRLRSQGAGGYNVRVLFGLPAGTACTEYGGGLVLAQ